MWFKNLRLYRLSGPFDYSAEALGERLTGKAFTPCGRNALFSYGWEAPLGPQGEMLVHAVNGCYLVCARREEKIMPAGVVRDMVREKVEAIEAAQSRKVRKRERDALRDELIQELLPRALCRTSRTFAYIAPSQGWLVVNASSSKTAEALLSLLRATLGTLAVTPLAVRQKPAAVMTRWLLSDDLPAGLVLEDECVLQSPLEEGGVVRCRRVDLESDEVRAHLDAGRQVERLALCWNESFSFLLDADLAIKRLRFSDVTREHADDLGAEDEAARFDADFSIMTLELSRFLAALSDFFGGEDREAARSGEQPASRVA